MVDGLVPLTELDDDELLWKGTRIRVYGVGLSVEYPTDDYYEYMLAEIPGDRDSMLLTCVVGYKAGSALSFVKTIADKSQFSVSGKGLKDAVGTDNVYLVKENMN